MGRGRQRIGRRGGSRPQSPGATFANSTNGMRRSGLVLPVLKPTDLAETLIPMKRHIQLAQKFLEAEPNAPDPPSHVPRDDVTVRPFHPTDLQPEAPALC